MYKNKKYYFTCSKCGKTVYKDNKYIHEVKCPMNNKKKNSYIYDYKCEICGIKMNIKEKDDHLYCHELEKNDYQNTNNFALNVENINNFSFSNENNNIIINNSESDSNSDSDSDSNENNEYNENNNRMNNRRNRRSSVDNIHRNRNKNSKMEILEKIVEKLNEKGYNKTSLMKISKDELKPILREIYKEYHNFGGLEKSPKEIWRNACIEILEEYKYDLKYTILKDYPITTIKNPSKLSEENRRCLICLEYFKNREKTIFLPCIHIFHSVCISKWVKNKNTCPVCKIKIEPLK